MRTGKTGAREVTIVSLVRPSWPGPMRNDQFLRTRQCSRMDPFCTYVARSLFRLPKMACCICGCWLGTAAGYQTKGMACGFRVSHTKLYVLTRDLTNICCILHLFLLFFIVWFKNRQVFQNGCSRCLRFAIRYVCIQQHPCYSFFKNTARLAARLVGLGLFFLLSDASSALVLLLHSIFFYSLALFGWC
jgi:hypothetical protein